MVSTASISAIGTTETMRPSTSENWLIKSTNVPLIIAHGTNGKINKLAIGATSETDPKVKIVSGKVAIVADNVDDNA